MTYEEAVDKVAKLIRLSKSSNPHEAALAAARAQEIMDKYSIEIAVSDIEAGRTKPEEPIQDFDREPVITGCQKDRQWVIRLTDAVGAANGCKTYFRARAGGADTYFIGRASDVATARYMTALLANEVRRLNREYCAGYSDKYRRDFKYGVVQAIANKLRDQWEATKKAARGDNNGMALVRVNQALVKMDQRLAEIEKWAKENKTLKQAGRSNYHTMDSAFAHGYRAGQTVNVGSRDAGAIGSSRRAIEG